MLTGVPLWTGLLGRISRPTVSIVYAVGPNAIKTHKYTHTQVLERNTVNRPVCLVYVKLSLGTEPITQHSKSIIFSTRKVKSEGRRSLATCLLQSKQEKPSTNNIWPSVPPVGELCWFIPAPAFPQQQQNSVTCLSSYNTITAPTSSKRRISLGLSEAGWPRECVISCGSNRAYFPKQSSFLTLKNKNFFSKTETPAFVPV